MMKKTLKIKLFQMEKKVIFVAQNYYNGEEKE